MEELEGNVYWGGASMDQLGNYAACNGCLSYNLHPELSSLRGQSGGRKGGLDKGSNWEKEREQRERG